MAVSIIDLASEPKDHFTTLPTELQHIIIGYLFPTHTPKKAFQAAADLNDRVKAASHSLDYLAATCKSLRAQVFDWARLFLTKHSSITHYKPVVESAETQSGCNYLRGIRGSLLEWAEKQCIFCGRKSSRSAILMNGFRCCYSCDMEQWPEKITKTEAMRAYDLKDHHLLPDDHHAMKLLTRHPGGLPKLRYGTYMCSSVPTTMFLRQDVIEVAELVHGDLRAHLAKRAADREERAKKAKEAKAKKEAELAAQLQDLQVQAQLMVVLNTVHHPRTRRIAAAPVVYEDEEEQLLKLMEEHSSGQWPKETGRTHSAVDDAFSELFYPAY